MIVLGLLTSAYAADVTVWHSYRGAEERALVEAAQTWGGETGNVVHLVEVPFGALSSKVETAVPRGNGPDAVIYGHDVVGRWSEDGLLLPQDVDRAGLVAKAADALTIDGTTWGAPLACKTVVLIYDPAKVPVPPTTTDELLDLARKLTSGDDYGLAYQASEPFFHAGWMHGFGGAAYGDDGHAHLDSAGQVAALKYVGELGATLPVRPSAERVAQLFRDGHAAMVINGPWFVADLDRPFAAAVLPSVGETGEPARPYLSVEAMYVAAGTAHPAEAKAFAAWLAGPEGARIRQDVGRQPVARTDLPTTDPFLAVLARQVETAVPYPSNPDVGNVNEAQARALRRVLRGAATPEDAAKEAQAYYDALSGPPPEPASPWPYGALAAFAMLGFVARQAPTLADASWRARVREHAAEYLWVLPAALSVVVLVVVPFLVGAAVAFTDYRSGTFVGLRHFTDILTSRDWPITSPMNFFYTLAVTVLWTVANLALHVSIGVALAMILREPWIRLRSVWRVLLIVPWAVPNYITALIWRTMFDAQYGAVNALIGLLEGAHGPAKIDWFGSFGAAFAANLATNTWLGFPFMMVVTLGALQSIPRELEEAAEVDGAGFFTRFRHVVWPLLAPALLPAVVLGSVWTFNMFNVIYLVSGGEPDGATEILISQAYRWAFQRGHQYGYAAAYAVIIFFVLLFYSRATNRLLAAREAT